MGLFSKLFGEKKNSETQRDASDISSHPDGFYIVRHSLGETQARELFYCAEKGDVAAQLEIAEIFKEAAEQPLALPWYERAAKAGNSQALYELSFFYEGAYSGIEAEEEKIEECLDEAIKMNNPNAIYKMGNKYFLGSGVEKDKKMAFRYYRKAAELGHKAAKTQMGLCYLNGDGVEINEEQAFYWFSVSEDPEEGYYYLAQCYLKGIGTIADVNKGITYLEKSVESRGIHFNQSRKQLIELYESRKGGKERKEKLERLQKEMRRSDDLISDLLDIL